jgi:lipid-A-disaccharide synthase
MKKTIFISAGELSGDIHAARLISELLNQRPDLKILANGGDNMQSAGADLVYHINEISFMGFAEVVKHLPLIKKIFSRTIACIEKNNVELVVLVDYPGFNLRLAKALHKRKINVIYYICPQIWAWHQSRVKQIKKHVDKAICILPFEPDWYTKHGVDAVYAGNPLMDKKLSKAYLQVSGLEEKDKFIGIFPGSRKQELDNHFDIMMNSAQKIRQAHPEIKFVVAMAPGQNFSEYRQKYDFTWLIWTKGENDAIMHRAEFLIMVSGTASLEAALIGTPMVIVYKTSAITYFLARFVASIEYIGLANIIAGEKGIHELIQKDVTPDKIFQEVHKYLTSPTEKERFETFCNKVQNLVGGPGASQKAASIILNHLKSK